MRYSVMIDGARHDIEIERDIANQWQVRLDGRLLAADLAHIDDIHLSLRLDDHSFDIVLRAKPQDNESSDTRAYEVIIDGTPYNIDLVDERRRALTGLTQKSANTGDIIIKAPMPGLVINVLVTPGDTVKQNQRVAVLEAMKMQNDLVAPRAGIVRAVKTQIGQAVNQGEALIVIGDVEHPA
jgi:biotin carboxyl carrier protein